MKVADLGKATNLNAQLGTIRKMLAALRDGASLSLTIKKGEQEAWGLPIAKGSAIAGKVEADLEAWRVDLEKEIAALGVEL